MTIEANKLLGGVSALRDSFVAPIDDSTSTKREDPLTLRYTHDPYFGVRGFVYARCDQSGGCTAGQLQSKRANVAITNISAGTTTSITTTGLTADILVGGILVCIDDAGAAGAAPEGEKGIVIANSATLVEIDTDDAFSVAPAANDDFNVVLPWAVDDSADGDAAGIVMGVAMAAHDQYDWGWFQFLGIHPEVDTDGDAIPVDESVVASTAAVGDGAGDAADLRVGRLLAPISADTVATKACVDLFCGPAFKMGLSAA